MQEVKIGCCGFCQSQKEYFKNFSVIELQNTFYQPPLKLKTVERLRKTAPSDFEFTIKAWQLITHLPSSPTYRRLKEKIKNKENYGFFKPTKEVFKAFERILEIAYILKSKIILFQTPPNFKEEKENIKNMQEFFKKADKNFIYVWEERGSWSKSTIKRLCKELNLIHCTDPFKKLPCWGDFYYFRLHGKTSYNYKYTEQELRMLLEFIKKKKSYVMFNNVHMKESALKFKEIISEKL